MGIVRLEHGLNVTGVSTRHAFVFAAPHPSQAMWNSRNNISIFRCRDADHDEMARIAMICAIFECAWDRPLMSDGNQQCEKRMSGAPLPNLPLPARSHHVAVQQAESLPKQERCKKVISLKTVSEKLNAWRRYRAAVRELSQLSDHDLSDIGIGRGQIENIARRPVVTKASA